MAAHHDHRLRCFAALRRLEVADAQIAVRRQPAVEFDLVRAGLFPAGVGGEVQEIGDDGLFHLVGAVSDKDDEPGVRLGHPRAQRSVGHALDPAPERRPPRGS